MASEWRFPAAVPADLPSHTYPQERLFVPGAITGQVKQRIDDAVIVVPGIMGTELIDTVSGRLLWGLKPQLLAGMWTAPARNLAPLAVDPDQAPGKAGVKPGRLLRFSTFAPILSGFEPYTDLVRELRAITLHPSAVLEFGYDWRLPVRHNAILLAEAIDKHLTTWRARSDRPDARVHVVAHSMGGLLCRALAAMDGATENIGTIVTLGTPFEGAAKSVLMLATGEGIPLPRKRLREIAVTMPGLYDLLPTYRCVDEFTTVRRLTPDDLAAFGADRDLAQAAVDDHARLAHIEIPQHRALVGTEQPTTSSLRLNGDLVEPRAETFRTDGDGDLLRESNGLLKRYDGSGDGTVPRNSAEPIGRVLAHSLAQQHGPLAKVRETITYVKDILLHPKVEPWQRLGPGEIGIDTPDIVTTGTEFDIKITGAEGPQDVHAYVTDLEGRLLRTEVHRRDGILMASTTTYVPGLYRVGIHGGGTSAVEQLVLAVAENSG